VNIYRLGTPVYQNKTEIQQTNIGPIFILFFTINCIKLCLIIIKNLCALPYLFDINTPDKENTLIRISKKPKSIRQCQKKGPLNERPFLLLWNKLLFLVFLDDIFNTIRRNATINLITNHYNWCKTARSNTAKAAH